MPGRTPTLYTYTYDTLTEITGMDRNEVYQHKTRGNFHPADFTSTLVWLVRHAKPEIKERIIHYMCSPHELPPNPIDKDAVKRAKTK